MKCKRLLPMAALSLIMSALSAQAAPTRIYVPQFITQPGNYILNNDITLQPGGYYNASGEVSVAIYISASNVNFDREHRGNLRAWRQRWRSRRQPALSQRCGRTETNSGDRHRDR